MRIDNPAQKLGAIVSKTLEKLNSELYELKKENKELKESNNRLSKKIDEYEDEIRDTISILDKFQKQIPFNETVEVEIIE